MIKCIEYGVSQNADRIFNLFGLYRYAMKILDVGERSELLSEFSQIVERQEGKGHMGLMMFLTADDNFGVCSSAALSLSVLFDPMGKDALAGPSFVVNTLLTRTSDPRSQGAGLGGVLLLGDKRVMPMLRDAWDQLAEEAQLEMSRAKSGFVSEGIVEFWLDCLEKDCSDSVFGSVVAAIANMPVIARVPLVLDMQREFPAYASAEPIRYLRKSSFRDYLAQIRPRLEALEKREAEPKVVPRICEMWENPQGPLD